MASAGHFEALSLGLCSNMHTVVAAGSFIGIEFLTSQSMAAFADDSA
jgi:hypothetical protein